MAVTKKIFKGRFLKGIKTDHILGMLALIFVAVLLLNYSKGKNLLSLPMTNRLNYSELNGQSNEVSNQPLSATYAPYNGV